jgi:hypothetical protein
MPVTFTNSGTLANDGWSMLGNPYASPVDWNAFHDAGRSGSDPDYSGTDYAHLDPTVYIFNATSNSYNSYSATANSGTLTNGLIPSGSAFFVKAVASSPSMTLRESHKASGTPASLHKSQNDELKIRLIASDIDYDVFTLKNLADANAAFDNYDIEKLKNPSVNLSSTTSDNADLTLDARPLGSANNTIIPLNVLANKEGTYTLDFTAVADFDANIKVELEDKLLNKIVDVRSQPVYSFAISSATNTWGKERFRLLLNKTATGSLENVMNMNTNFYLYPNPAHDHVNIGVLNEKEKSYEVSVVDVSGKVVMNGNLDTRIETGMRIDTDALPAGAYFVSLSENGRQVKTLRFIK